MSTNNYIAIIQSDISQILYYELLSTKVLSF